MANWSPEDDKPKAPMNWQRGSNQQQYTLTSGICQALVWYQPAGEWTALISRNHTAINHNFFKNLMEA